MGLFIDCAEGSHRNVLNLVLAKRFSCLPINSLNDQIVLFSKASISFFDGDYSYSQMIRLHLLPFLPPKLHSKTSQIVYSNNQVAINWQRGLSENDMSPHFLNLIVTRLADSLPHLVIFKKGQIMLQQVQHLEQYDSQGIHHAQSNK